MHSSNLPFHKGQEFRIQIGHQPDYSHEVDILAVSSDPESLVYPRKQILSFGNRSAPTPVSQIGINKNRGFLNAVQQIQTYFRKY